MNNRDVFISDSIILASIFCRTRGLDLCGLNIEPSNYCAVPAEVPWSQDRKLERSPTKFNIYGMIDLAENISSPLWMQLFKLAVRRNLPPFSLIDKQNTRVNVCKIFISLACYWQIGSKSTNCSHLCDLLTFSTSFYRAVIGGFRSDLSTVACVSPGTSAL